ncbi:MAG: hypothetical protein ACRDOH_09565 [Streptosporangiaceae bacterium]
MPPAACRVTADAVADRAAGRLGGDLIAPVGEPGRAGIRYRPCGRLARRASGTGSFISSQPSPGFQRIVSLPRALSFSRRR